MLYVYISFLALGGVFMILSLIGGDNDVEFDGDMDADFSGDADIDADGDFDSDGDSSVVEAVRFFSFRNFIYFSAFFGLTGTIFTLINFQFIITLASSLSMGIFAWFIGFKFMAYLKRTESGEVDDLKYYEGTFGKVDIDVSKDIAGKITLDTGSSILSLVAKVAEESSVDSFKANEEVTVIRIEDNIAFIAEKTFINS